MKRKRTPTARRSRARKQLERGRPPPDGRKCLPLDQLEKELLSRTLTQRPFKRGDLVDDVVDSVFHLRFAGMHLLLAQSVPAHRITRSAKRLKERGPSRGQDDVTRVQDDMTFNRIVSYLRFEIDNDEEKRSGEDRLSYCLNHLAGSRRNVLNMMDYHIVLSIQYHAAFSLVYGNHTLASFCFVSEVFYQVLLEWYHFLQALLQMENEHVQDRNVQRWWVCGEALTPERIHDDDMFLEVTDTVEKLLHGKDTGGAECRW